MICKVCHQDKQKIRAERKPTNPGEFRYRDERGLVWHGLICPDCNAPKGLKAKNEEWVEEELAQDLDWNPDPLTDKKCRKCEKPLPKSRYFFHEECEVRGIDWGMEGLGGF